MVNAECPQFANCPSETSYVGWPPGCACVQAQAWAQQRWLAPIPVALQVGFATSQPARAEVKHSCVYEAFVIRVSMTCLNPLHHSTLYACAISHAASNWTLSDM